MGSGVFPIIPIYQVSCVIGNSNILATSTSMSVSNTFPITFPEGSNKFFPSDTYSVSNVEIGCLVYAKSSHYPVIQVNTSATTQPFFYYYPTMKVNTGVTTTGVTCNPVQMLNGENEPFTDYVCPQNVIPMIINYKLRFSSKRSLGDFDPRVLKISSKFYRTSNAQYLPVITVIFMWLTFAGNFMTNIVPLVFYKRPLTDFILRMNGLIMLFFSYSQL